MKSLESCTAFQDDVGHEIDLDYCSYKVVGDSLKTRVVGISDVDCETSGVNDVNETERDVTQVYGNRQRDVKQIQGDILCVGLDGYNDIELTMSLECNVNNPDPTHEDRPTDFNDETRTYCCDCHCTRNFQQRDQTTLQSLKSGNSDRETSSRHLLNHHSIGVENDIKRLTYRTRLKLSRKLHASTELVSIRSDDQACEESTIKLRSSESFTSNMALIVGYITTFVVLLCLCGVVFMMNHSSDSKHMVNNTNSSSVHYAALNTSQKFIETTTEPRIIKDLPYRSVSKDEFEHHLANSNTAGDLLKIFFDDQTLTAEQVNSIIHMKKYYVTSSDEKQAVDQTDEYTDTDTVLQRNPVADDDIKARELALQHNSEVSNHPFSVCKHPQPELVPVELHSDDAVRYIYPKCTLLHRCRNTTGCCGMGSVCVPRKKDGIELIDRYFLVIEHTPGSSGVKPAKDIVVGKRFVNHTACECQPLITETNCRKDCPRHFVKKRHSANCQCICRSGIKHCKQVIRGLAPLEEEGLACIKEGKCIVPDCLSGDFMINTGYCPALRRHGHNRRHHGKHRKRRG